MRLFFVFLLGLIVGCAGGPTRAPASGPSREVTAVELASKTIALIEPADGEVRLYCSGVWVGPKTILTAHHCVAEQKLGDLVTFVTRDDVLDRDGKEHLRTVRPSALVVTDEAHDLALLCSRDQPPHGIATFGGLPVAGSFAQAMGHPMGLWFSYSSGDIAAVRTTNAGLESPITWIQATVPISPGNSGGGLFNAAGDLIGIASRARTGRAQLLNLFVPIEYALPLPHCM